MQCRIHGFFYLFICLFLGFPHSPLDSPALGQESGGEIMLSPKSAILRGIKSNFGLKAQSQAIPKSQEEVTVQEAKFDPAIEASLSAQERKIPTGFVFYEDGFEESDRIEGGAGIRKAFRSGLQGGISFETYRSRDNFLADSLNPEYRGTVTLNLIQPILRDFGKDINLTEINAAKNRVQIAFMSYTAAARTLAEQVERLYYELCRAHEVLRLQVESMQLALELKKANQNKFENGTVSITPVTEAKTAVTDRREKIIFAEQQLELASNQMKNLLEITTGQDGFENRVRTLPMSPPSRSYPGLENALNIAMSKRSDLKEIQIALENQDLMIAWLENKKLPRLDFLASAGVNGLAGGDDPVDLFGRFETSRHVGDYWESLSNMTEAEGGHWSAGLRFVYPIGNRAARSRHVQSKYEKLRLKYLLERFKGQIRMEVSNGVLSAEKSFARVKETERFVAHAQETLDQENQLLEEGLSTTFRILSHQENLVAARIRRVNALADFHKSVAALYRAMGENLKRRNILLEIQGSVFAF